MMQSNPLPASSLHRGSIGCSFAARVLAGIQPIYESIALELINEREIGNVRLLQRQRVWIFRRKQFSQGLHSRKGRARHLLEHRSMKRVQLLYYLAIFD